MPIQHPKLDIRTFQDILKQLREIAQQKVPEWAPSQQGDAGIMLHRIFARMMELALTRLNQVPEKNLLAFLDKMGISPLPPSPARVPLSFVPASDSSPTLIPKGTQVITEPTASGQPIIFETEDDLTLQPSKITKAYTIDPTWDRFTDLTEIFAGQQATGFSPFVGTKKIPHILYIGDDLLFDFHKATVELSFKWNFNDINFEDLKNFLKSLSWEYLNMGQIIIRSPDFPVLHLAADVLDEKEYISIIKKDFDSVCLEVGNFIRISEGENSDEVEIIAIFKGENKIQVSPILVNSYSMQNAIINLVNPLIIRFIDVQSIDQSQLQGISESEILRQGINSHWIYARLNHSIRDEQIVQSLKLKNIHSKVSAAEIFPDLAFSNTVPLDVSKEFYPFGSVPNYGDAFYLASQEIFSKPNIQVTLNVEVEAPTLVPTLKWEYWNGNAWVQHDPDLIQDESRSFTKDGLITLNNLEGLNKINIWGPFFIRITLLSGCYRGTPKLTLVSYVALAGNITQNQNHICLNEIDFIDTRTVLIFEKNNKYEYVLVQRIDKDNKQIEVIPSFENEYVIDDIVKFGILPQIPTSALEEEYYGNNDEIHIKIETPWTTINKNDLLLIKGTFYEFVEVLDFNELNGTIQITLKNELKKHHESREPIYKVHRLPDDLIGLRDFDIVDIKKEFYPFGKQPGIGSDFYIGTYIGFEPTTRLIISQEMEWPDVTLDWEFLNNNGWQPIGDEQNIINDSTNSFMQSGNILLPMRNYNLAEFSGFNNFWIRVRIVSGDFGKPIEYEPIDPLSLNFGFRVKTGSGNLIPPVIKKLTLNYNAEQKPLLISQNETFFKDHTELNNNDAEVDPFVPVENITPARYANNTPAFYLGFDLLMPEQAIDLYIVVKPEEYGDNENKKTSSLSNFQVYENLQWEYFNGSAWKELTVFDNTNNLTRSGSIEFLTPKDISPLAKFDLAPHYWIRVCTSTNDPLDSQRILGVYMNTVPAIQTDTITDEILGSSNGQPNQIFYLTKKPVLPGQPILVREPEYPSYEEITMIIAEEGKDAVQEITNALTDEKEIWVRWHEVTSFLPSRSYHRHYLLDHLTGKVIFGDGSRGMIPPSGMNNIKVASYRTGGGAAGNQLSGKIKQLKTSMPVVASVFNPIAADGGADVESIQMVEERGPQLLRHRHRAVAESDIEWLAKQAVGTKIARVKCLPNLNRDLQPEPGWITLIIVPQGPGAKLSPSSALIRDVENYLQEHYFAGLSATTSTQLNVIGPGYIEVSVDAEVVPVDIDAAEQVKRQVLEALNQFLHPLQGGPDDEGWEFGRDVYASEVCQIIERVEGVDHVKSLRLRPNSAQFKLGIVRERPIVEMELPAGSLVSTIDGKRSGILLQPIESGTLLSEIFVQGFKEGDWITKIQDIKVDKVEGDTITIVGYNNDDEAGFPQGSIVKTYDGSKQTRLKKGIIGGGNILQIVIEEDGEEGNFANIGDKLTLYYPFPIRITNLYKIFKLTGDLLEVCQVINPEPFMPVCKLKKNLVMSTLDNRIRLALYEDIEANQICSAFVLSYGVLSFGDIEIARIDKKYKIGGLRASVVNFLDDKVFIDENYLVYPGEHSVIISSS